MENKIKLMALIGIPSSTDLGGCKNSILTFVVLFTPLLIQSLNFTQNCVCSKFALKCPRNKKVKNKKHVLGWKLANIYVIITKIDFFHILGGFRGLRFSEEISIFYLFNIPCTPFRYEERQFQYLYVKFWSFLTVLVEKGVLFCFRVIILYLPICQKTTK